MGFLKACVIEYQKVLLYVWLFLLTFQTEVNHKSVLHWSKKGIVIWYLIELTKLSKVLSYMKSFETFWDVVHDLETEEIKWAQLYRVLLLSAVAMLFGFWLYIYIYYFLSDDTLRMVRKDLLSLQKPELCLTNCL